MKAKRKLKRQEFMDKHDPDPDHVEIMGWLLFSDGTQVQMNSGAKIAPPKDAFECNQLIHRFWNIKLEQATKKFVRLKKEAIRNTTGSLRGGYRPLLAEQEAMIELEALRDKIIELKRKAKNMLFAASGIPEGKVAFEERHIVNERNALALLGEINAIEI